MENIDISFILIPDNNGIPIKVRYNDNSIDNYDETNDVDIPYPYAPPFGYKNTIYFELNDIKIKELSYNGNNDNEQIIKLHVVDVSSDNVTIT